jgi:hypothetical protein
LNRRRLTPARVAIAGPVFGSTETSPDLEFGRRRFPPFSAAKRRRSFVSNRLQGVKGKIFARAPGPRSICISSASRVPARKWTSDEGLFDLDFLGFSRAESSFSMGCEA